MRDIEKKEYMPYEYTILQEIKSEDLEFIWDLESKIKRTQRHKKYTPLIPFGGSVNECFLESLDYEEK